MHYCRPDEVIVISVTYGNRTEMLERMARSVSAEGVRQIFVFGNGLSEEAKRATRSLAGRLDADFGVVMILSGSPQNLGSAAGYASLLAATERASNMRAVWFLDDDNAPEPGCLTQLLKALAITEGAAVSAVRRDRIYMMNAVSGGEVTFPASGEVFGRDVRRTAKRALLKLSLSKSARKSPGRHLDVPVAFPRVPYGGLLIPAGLTRDVAPPREDFVLYADDYEYSCRLSKAKGLYIVPKAYICDSEPSWNANSAEKIQHSQLTRMALMPPNFRLFFALRNAIYLDRRRTSINTWPWFVVNLAWLLADFSVRAIVRGRFGNLSTVFSAAWSGVLGKLGAHPRYPLP